MPLSEKIMEKIIISACLLGTPCRYDGKAKSYDKIEKLKEKYELIPVCPEVFGGLDTPREPCEVSGQKVISKSGKDRTKEYTAGAQKALATALQNGCKLAVLKSKSPSCGHGEIYDGSFSGSLIKGNGVAARLLEENGIKVISELQIHELF